MFNTTEELDAIVEETIDKLLELEASSPPKNDREKLGRAVRVGMGVGLRMARAMVTEQLEDTTETTNDDGSKNKGS